MRASSLAVRPARPRYNLCGRFNPGASGSRRRLVMAFMLQDCHLDTADDRRCLRQVRAPGLACLLVLGVSCGGKETRSTPPASLRSVTTSATAISGTLVKRLGTIKFEGSPGDLIAFGPDGKTIVLGSRGTAIRLWDVASGRERMTIESGHKSVWGWAVAPNGAAVATVGFDGGVRVHALSSGKEVLAIPAEGSHIAVAFSPDSTMLAYAGMSERTVHLADAVTGQPRQSFAIDNGTKQIGFSPDGRTLAVEVGGTVYLHDVASGKPRLKLPGDILGSRFGWSRDGKALARVDYRGLLRIADPTTGGDLVPPLGFGLQERGQAVAFSPDGALLAVGLSHDVDGPVLFLVDTKTGQKTAVGDERHAIDSLAFSPDGSVLATASRAGIRLWSVPEGSDLSRTGHERPVGSAAFSADGSTVATGSADSVYLWRTADGELTGSVDVASIGGKTRYPPLAFAPDGSLAIVVGRTVAFWDPATRHVARRVQCARETVGVAALAPDTRWLVAGTVKTGTDRPEVVRFALEDGNPAWSVTPDVARAGGSIGGALPLANMVTALAVAPDGETIAAAFFAGELLLLEARSGRTVRPFSKEKKVGGVLAAAFSPDGQTLATAEISRAPELWNVATGDRRCAIGSATTILTGPSFSHDGKVIAASEVDGSISFFDVATCVGLGNMGGGAPSPKGDYAQVLAFAPGDVLMVSGHLDHTARLWRLVR
jgi:WD40 repeat protein